MARAKPSVETLELDLRRYELRRRGRQVRIEKKPMELLIFLVAHKELLVSRKEIVQKLWRSELFIDTDANINNIVRKLRVALGDNSEKPRFLETVVGKGYRFIGPVSVIDRLSPPGRELEITGEANTAHTTAVDDRASLAVRPLILAGGISDDHGVCLGFADALVARLGNLEGADVLPTSATLNLPQAMTAAQVGSRLSVRYVIHGAIRELKGQWRLSLEMLDTRLQQAAFTWKCDLDLNRLSDLEDEIAKQIAAALNRPLRSPTVQRRPRYSNDPTAYAEFMRGYRFSSSGEPAMLDAAARYLSNAVERDPEFSLAHAILSTVCAARHFEFDPTSTWLQKAEFHCHRALEVDPDLPEGHVAKAFLLWGPSKNFQHLDAIEELRRAIALQKNLPHAYNRLGTILAHIGLLGRAREIYESGRPFQPAKAVSHSIVQVYMWSQDYDLAGKEIRAWRTESPANKYPLYYAPQLAMMIEDWSEAKALLDEAVQVLPDEALIVSLLGVYYARTGNAEQALQCMVRACGSAKSFGHAHHTYYQIACILAVLERRTEAFEWLERSVGTGFACWPFFLKDPCLRNLHSLTEFADLVHALRAKYPDHLGLL